MIIEARLLTSNQNVDVLRFELNPPVDVRLTSTDGAKDLQVLFVELLKLLINDQVEISLIENPDYKNQMYFNICTEYILDLNKDLAEAKCEIKELGADFTGELGAATLSELAENGN